jgi:hypothetical protein
MAGYSGTPLPKKLGIGPGARVTLISAPARFAETLGELPPNVVLADGATAPTQVILLFVSTLAELRSRFGSLVPLLAPKGGFWVAWPKKSSGVSTDLHENAIREIGLATGLVDNKVCAIDDVWSGLRFVHRRRPTSREMTDVG